MLKMLLSNQVDGVLMASAHPPNDSVWQSRLAQLTIPLVLIDRRLPSMTFVGVDDEAIGFEATQHLFGQGYRRIAHIAGPKTISTAVGRLKGYLRALKSAGLKVKEDFVIESNYHEESGGYNAMHQLLRLVPRPDAVFAASDPIAIGALQAALEAGLRLPRDIGLIGVGNHRYGPYLRVPLSTVDQQRTKIGHSAANLILELMDEERFRARSILVEPKLVIRDSSSRGGRSRAGMAARSAGAASRENSGSPKGVNLESAKLRRHRLSA
jgi:LacI family transcriptional regulator